MEILQQLGELFLAALPTTIIVFLFYLFLRWAFFGPLLKVMEERRARTEGARREAEAAQADAHEKVRAYQDALKRVRVEIYAEQDAARRAALDERGNVVRDARARANEEVRAGKERLAVEAAAARKELEAASGALAEAITRAILRPASPGPRPASEAR